MGGRNSGRPRKPAALRALHGSRSRPYHGEEPQIPDPGADDSAEVPDDSEPIPPPTGLTPAEREYWTQFAPLLRGAKVLTPADVETLADYCRACVAVDERGEKLRTAWAEKDLDQKLVRLLDGSLRGWVERKTKLAGELGLTAVSRTRVAWSGHSQRIDPVKKPKSKLAQLQEQAAALRRPVGVK